MIRWHAFEYAEETYELDHIHPEIWLYTQPKSKNNPPITYKISIVYSLHCFTKRKEEKASNILDYADNREVRTFCFNRYHWSKILPEAIKNLDQGYVYHTGRQNFLRIPRENKEYEIFFTLIKSSDKNIDLNLYVSSAYCRTKGNTPKAGKVRFSVIAFNTQNNKPIKVYRR